jgi:hypothetical protein
MPNHGKKSARRIRHRDLRAMIAAFQADIGARIPLGYQDETGFHFGIAPISSIVEHFVDSLQPARCSSFGW